MMCYLLFLSDTVFLPDIDYAATLTTEELFRWRMMRQTHSNSPCALQCLET